MISIIEDTPHWMVMRTFQKNVICKKCRGKKLVKVITEDPGYDGPEMIPCNACGGDGMVVKVKTVRFEKIKGER